MALKTSFEDADFISSPFVDEVANPGIGSAGIDNARAAINRELRAQELSNKADDFIKRGGKPKASPAKPKGVIDKRNTGQKIMDKDAKIREALGN